jgi:hypothetical protein
LEHAISLEVTVEESPGQSAKVTFNP